MALGTHISEFASMLGDQLYDGPLMIHIIVWILRNTVRAIPCIYIIL